MDPRDALRHVYFAALRTQADAAVGRAKLTTLATIDVPWRNFSQSPASGTRFGIPEFASS